MYGTNPQGDLTNIEGVHNEWLSINELESKDKKFESLVELVEFAKKSSGELLEKKYHYESNEY